jgi:predicted anti-sigma-YlaC factor YlaD
MICDQFREAVSARLDGEDAGLPTAMLDAHLDNCAACAAWATAAAEVTRSTRVTPADLVPDRTGAILAVAADRGLLGGDAAYAERRWRWVLAAVAVLQLAAAVPSLLLGEDAGATVHVARELGSFDVALAVGLLVAAWQPARAWGLLPVAGALAFVMVVTAGLDLLEGSVSTLGEAHHLLDLAGVALLWAVAREVRPAPRPASRATRWSAA